MSSDEEDSDCPLCMEELDIADRNFRPCPCGYQICRFCWHHIKTNLNGRCPACRRLYSDQIVEFVPVSAEEIMRLKKEKKEKDRQTRDMRDPSRRQLSNVRVVQKNLVYVLGLSVKHASVDNEFFKKYGRIDKVVISKRSAPSSGSNSSVGIYVTFTRKEDAGKAIEGLNGMEYDGKTLRASYGTTKYCTYYLRHMTCPNPNCMYLHEPGDDVDSYSKDTVAIGKHANPSVNTASASAYPNKRPATASALKATSTASASSTTTSAATATTPEPKPATVPRTWAPIPKVVPIPPVVIPKEEPPVTVTSPSVAAATANAAATAAAARPPSPPFEIVVKSSASSNKKAQPTSSSSITTIKASKSTSTAAAASKKPAVEKSKKNIIPLVPEEGEKPALPATASWAKAQPVVNHESVITPANFGPSLSDALNAPQKPKHSPSLKVKKEKKSKGKMVRLEDFEEAEREAKMAASRPKTVVPKPPVAQPAPAVSTVNEAAAKPVQQQAAKNEVNMDQEAPAPAVSEKQVEKAVEQTPTNTTTDQAKMEIDNNDQVKSDEIKVEESPKPEMVEIKNNVTANEKVQDEVPVITTKEEVEQVEDENMETERQEEEVAVDTKEEVVADEVMNEDIEEGTVEDMESTEEGDTEKIEDLAALNDEIIKAFDHAAHESSEKAQADGQQDTSDVLSEHSGTSEHLAQTISSPMAAMDRLSALVQQEIMTDTPDTPQFEEMNGQQQQQFHLPQQQQQQQQDLPPGMNRFDLGLPMQQQQPDHRRSPMPPPGLGGLPPPPPPEWMNRSFDPFNGQDPSLIAARRLQHSQRMLEASGLFAGGGPGFGHHPHPPVVPRFGFSPDFNHGPPPPPTGFLSHHQPPPPPPPLAMFPPPPHHPAMMRGPHPPPPEMMNMQSPFGPPPPVHHQQQPPQQQQQQQQMQHMDDLRNEFSALKMDGNNHGLQQQQEGGDHQQSRDDFRALLPNVNISFNNLQEKRRAEKFYQQQLLMRQQQQMQRMSEQQQDQQQQRGDIPTQMDNNNNNSPLRHPSFNNISSPMMSGNFHTSPPLVQQQFSQEKILTRSPVINNQWQQQQPQQMPPAAPSPLGGMMMMEQRENADPMDDNKRNNPDVRVEAQNFFGEFLRKAASSTTPQPADEMSPKKEEQPIQQATSLPFQDPAIMSVRLNNDVSMNNDAVHSQNTILQILGGQPPPPSPLMSLEQQQHHHHQQQMHQQHQFLQQRQQQQQQQQRQMDPRFMMDQQGRMMHQQQQEGNNNFNEMKHFNNMFMGGGPPPPPNFQQHHPQQQQQQPPFHQQQPGSLPPPPSSFMSRPAGATGFREHPNMGMMGRMGPPPGMMRPPMPPPQQQQQNDMRFRNNFNGPPPGMFNSMNEEGGHQ